MKTLKHTTLLLALALMPTFLWAQYLERTIEKSFDVGSSGELFIRNSFGDVQLTDYPGNSIEIEVKITVEGKSDRAVNEAFEKMDVKFSVNGDRVVAETKNDCNCGNKIEKFSIDYEVRVPQSTQVEIRNSFGDVFVEDRYGPTRLDVQHGDFRVSGWSHEQNEIELAFGDGFAKNINGLNAEIQHSDFIAENIKALELDVKFSDVEIERVEKMIGDLRVQHSDFNLDVAGVEWDAMDLDVDFSDFELSINEQARMRMEIKASFSDVDGASGMKIQEKETGFNSEEYRITVNDEAAPIIRTSVQHSDFNISWR
ncbi:hypothetical protein HZ996_12460 [Cryomorphaceae bacterium]|nr:hypothetical protein HZ996_12460 [Cryomorphaceae bacterium]